MKTHTQTPTAHYTICLEKGEKIMDTLTRFCREHAIANARFEGIGAVENITMGYYDRDTREYVFTQYSEVMEVAALLGNVALVNDEPFLHVHVVLSDTDNKAHAGHIEEMEVAVTVEIQLTVFAGDVHRVYNDTIGLKLLDL